MNTHYETINQPTRETLADLALQAIKTLSRGTTPQRHTGSDLAVYEGGLALLTFHDQYLRETEQALTKGLELQDYVKSPFSSLADELLEKGFSSQILAQLGYLN